jgi:YesN/AraC family two-component response regulator
MREYPGCFSMGYRDHVWGGLFTFDAAHGWSSMKDIIDDFFTTLTDTLSSGTRGRSDEASAVTGTSGEHRRSTQLQRTTFGSASLIAGMSKEGRGLESLCGCYDQASTALKYWFLRGKGKIIKYAAVSTEIENSTVDPETKARSFRQLLDRQDFTALKENKETFCVHSIHMNPGQIGKIKRLFVLYSFYIGDFFDRYSFPGEQSVRAQLNEFNERVRYLEDLQGHNRWLRSTIDVITEVICGKSQLIHNAVRYIQDHLATEVSLRDIASHLQVSEAYLSRKFSKEVGMRLSHFISRVKMEHAAERLKNSNLKIYQISEMVGYSNPEHFSRVFKKFMGKSPKQFTGK